MALAGLSFMLTLIWGSPALRLLRHLRMAERIQIVSPQGHFTRLGTPTFGGLLIILPVLLLTLLLNAVGLLTELYELGRSILLPIAALIAFGALGALGDLSRIRSGARGGMRVRDKLFWQIVLAVIFALLLRFVLDVPEMYFPFYRGEYELNNGFLLVAVLVMLGSINGVNSSGGVGGLAGMISATAFAAYGAIAIFQGQIFVSRFCFSIVGAILAFLWFNVKPASLLLGNTGTFALGGALGVIALMTGHWPLLPLIAVIPFAEVASLLIQGASVRLGLGSRILRMAPLHLHYELAGWSEGQIIQRFWLINLLFAMIGITLALV
jgi:phospho-N-acetylmuramoyl-pentapeptide-transferase